jgi:MarR family transcriptional regulator, organic hydroperoxide resistance regulator
VTELSTRLKLDSSTITPLLKRLEKIEFISRKRNVEDERVVNVSLTVKGRDLEHEVAELQKEVACQTKLSEPDFFKLRDTLHDLVDTINKHQKIEKEAA